MPNELSFKEQAFLNSLVGSSSIVQRGDCSEEDIIATANDVAELAVKWKRGASQQIRRQRLRTSRPQKK